ncbi:MULTISPECIES: hypothetical protein [unclassified Microcoleus]|uniref:hypothetical protein n=1 Tax=unclassified Microcoleus TaxID=2642155 RepID=UPI0025F9844C|nr:MULTISPECIES: hypothetical protein [unclassified Microcoleus]
MKIENWGLGIGNWELVIGNCYFFPLPSINCQLSTERAGTGALPLQLSTVNRQPSTANCQQSTDYGIRQILIVRSGLPLTKVLLSLEIATEFTN